MPAGAATVAVTIRGRGQPVVCIPSRAASRCEGCPCSISSTSRCFQFRIVAVMRSVHGPTSPLAPVTCRRQSGRDIMSVELLESVINKNPLTTVNGGIMQAQLITYQLKDISQAEYLKQMVEPDAPVLAKVPGLISKIWLADEEKNTFGGFYLWENKTAMEDFMHSDLVKAVVSRPFVKNVSSVDFEVNQKASLITRGLK